MTHKKGFFNRITAKPANSMAKNWIKNLGGVHDVFLPVKFQNRKLDSADDSVWSTE